MNQLSYRPGAPPCDDLTVMDFGGTRLLQGHWKKATASRSKTCGALISGGFQGGSIILELLIVLCGLYGETFIVLRTSYSYIIWRIMRIFPMSKWVSCWPAAAFIGRASKRFSPQSVPSPSKCQGTLVNNDQRKHVFWPTTFQVG